MDTMHLFAGAGGGLLGDIILGHNPIVAVEWEPYACQVLRERAADGWFPHLRVYEGDVRMFDPSEYTGRVDCIHAGFPCQDISTAGKQAGIGDGTRSNLYKEVLRIASIVRPRYIFLENVAAITSRGKDYLEVIGKDLAEIGFDAVWTTLSAAEVGANHKRDRWWCLGYSKHAGQYATEITRSIASGNDGQPSRAKQASESARPSEQYDDVAYSASAQDNLQRGIGEFGRNAVGWNQQTAQCNNWETSDECVDGCGENVADTNITQRKGRSVSSRIHSQHSNPGERGWWQVEPNVGRVADGLASRVDKLKALGNGQVPLQAAVAFKILEAMIQ